jgi:hypothetical protein
LLIEQPADRLDGLGRARVDRFRARVRDAADADDWVPGEAAPLDCAMEHPCKTPSVRLTVGTPAPSTRSWAA